MGDLWSRGMPRERVTGAYPTIPTNHALIHAGLAFNLAGTLVVASGKTGTIRLAVPAVSDEFQMYAHFNPVVISTNAGPTTITLWEGKSVTGSESAITPVNRNRILNAASDIDCFKCTDATLGDPQGTTPTLIDTMFLGGTSVGNSKLGAALNQYDEWLLKPDTDYVLALKNDTAPGTNVTFGYTLFWYEEEGY